MITENITILTHEGHRIEVATSVKDADVPSRITISIGQGSVQVPAILAAGLAEAIKDRVGLRY